MLSLWINDSQKELSESKISLRIFSLRKRRKLFSDLRDIMPSLYSILELRAKIVL